MKPANHRLLRLTLLLTLALLSPFTFCETLIVGVAPSIPGALAKYTIDTSVEQTKRFQKLRYRKSQVPSQQQIWQSLVEYLSQETTLALQLDSASSTLDFELKLAKGYYDLAYMLPTQFASFSLRPGYKAIAKRKAQPLRGILVTRAQGPIQSLRQLRSKSITFPGLLDFAASIAPRHSLLKLNFPIQASFVASQDLSYQQVLDGSALATGGTRESFEALHPDTREQLKIIWDTPGYTPYAFAAHTRTPFFSIIKLQRALAGMTKTEKGKALLPLLLVENGFETAKDSDWHDAADIDLDSLNHAPAITTQH